MNNTLTDRKLYTMYINDDKHLFLQRKRNSLNSLSTCFGFSNNGICFT